MSLAEFRHQQPFPFSVIDEEEGDSYSEPEETQVTFPSDRVLGMDYQQEIPQLKKRKRMPYNLNVSQSKQKKKPHNSKINQKRKPQNLSRSLLNIMWNLHKLKKNQPHNSKITPNETVILSGVGVF
jgi:hypothetical protein